MVAVHLPVVAYDAEPARGLSVRSYQVGVETGPLAGELAGPVVVVGRGQPPPPQTWFCEHVNFGGVSITLAKNRGYYDLRDVTMGFFGNWNDEISSVAMIGTQVTVLHEHIQWTGSTLTLFGSEATLVPLGWNDRASSLETW